MIPCDFVTCCETRHDTQVRSYNNCSSTSSEKVKKKKGGSESYLAVDWTKVDIACEEVRDNEYNSRM